MSTPILEHELVEIYSGNLWEAELLKSIFDDTGIPSFLKNNVLSSFAYKPGYSQGEKIMIRQLDFSNASKIVKEFPQKTRMKESPCFVFIIVYLKNLFLRVF